MAKVKCPHEGNIEYGKFNAGDNTYPVTCSDCGAVGVIQLEEVGEEWQDG